MKRYTKNSRCSMHIRFPLSVAVTSWPISPITAADKDLHSKISFFSKLFTESPKVAGPNCCVATVVHPEAYHRHILLFSYKGRFLVDMDVDKIETFNITGLCDRKTKKHTKNLARSRISRRPLGRFRL